ncbi:hypothetical protein EJ05DRAFT_7255 [Pseudovirgaria hyperparasitica]|uniref:DUF4211 domain-containing protein n=1 Tax=Pseudovirgaria hyperparasitica TaxID=470096 RepID=A0A6A6WKA3_9PEZI|nr:uncharacterized protein EJ05DRAFT_7255 [Pseudovirgaria hyperparasitica]KAF2762601.1 hypothetical protein EJ05DRAFT_7255 [Pseudovirgaria hyperparasitica]
MATRSSRAKKRQARLNFSSAPSSSPKATELPSAVRHRAAAVTYDSSPLKRKLAALDSDDEEQSNPNFGTLPTPPSHSTRASKRARRSQAKIDFSKHIGTKVSRSPSPSAPSMKRKVSQGKAAKKFRPASGIFGKKPVVELSSSSECEEDIIRPRTATPKKQTQVTTRGSSRKAAIEAEDDEDEDEVQAPRSARRLRRPTYDESSEQSGEQELDDDVDTGAIGEPETSGDETMKSSPTYKPKRKPSRKADMGFINDEETGKDSKAAPPSSRIRKGIKKMLVEEEHEEEKRSSAEEDEDEDDDDKIDEDENDDDEDDKIISSQRRRLRIPNRIRNSEELEDLKEDLEFLQSSPPPESAGRLRSTGPRKLNPREKALEALKRRRLGNNAPIPEESNEEEASSAENTASDVGPEDSIAEEEEEEPENYDAELEGFVLEDDEATIGIPIDMPVAFSAHARLKPKQLFKYVVEWMVHKRINPAFEMKNEIYQLAFNRLDDEAQGLGGSKYKSSIWNRDFIMALNARPKIIITDLGGGAGGIDLGGCEACNRSSHAASFVIRFSGKPYHRKSLENVADETDSDDSNSDKDDDVERDARGNPIPNENRAWNVGSFCKGNAEIAHTLEHWRYHLNEWIVDWLNYEGYLAPEKIVARDKWSMKKKGKYADRIVDAMAEATPNEIERLYHDFRTQVNAARDNQRGYHSTRRR